MYTYLVVRHCFQRTIVRVLTRLCYFTGPLRLQCLSFIKRYGTMILDLAETELTPKLCKTLHLCDKVVPVPGNPSLHFRSLSYKTKRQLLWITQSRIEDEYSSRNEGIYRSCCLRPGEKGHLFQGNRGTKTILGNKEHKKTNFRFLGSRGTNKFNFRGTKKQVHPPPPLEGLFITVVCNCCQFRCTYSDCLQYA